MLKPKKRAGRLDFASRTSTSLAIVFLVLAACSQIPNIPSTSRIFGSSATLTVDMSDPCHQQRQDFSEGQNFFTKAIFSKAIRGATSGGVQSLVSSGSFSTALNSALSGGLAGARSGYLDALQQEHHDEQQLADQINADLHRESSAIDHTTAAFATLRACRLTQAKRVKSAAQTRRIEQAEARRQLKQEHDWFAEEIEVAQNAGINMQKRDDQFTYAANNLQNERTTGHARPQTESAVEIFATETIPQKRNSFESSVKEAQAESNTAFSLDNNAAARMRHYA
jgi:uncharacterized protein YdbL (DUF1318 family)